MSNLPPRIYLETERMILREITKEDELLIFDLDSDPEVMKYLTNGIPSTMEHVRTSLIRTDELMRKHQGKFGFWAAELKPTSEFMGWFLFRPSKKDPENTKRVELGYRFKRAYWGHGFATEGSLALIKKGFLELNVDCVFATAMKANLASQAVMKKVGLKFVREYVDLEYGGKDQLDVEYELSLQDWKAAVTLKPK